MLYQLGVFHQHNLKSLYLIMIHDNNKQLVVKLDYQLVKKGIGLIISIKLHIHCYSIKCDLSLDSFQHNIMRYIITCQRIHFPKVNLKDQSNIITQFCK